MEFFLPPSDIEFIFLIVSALQKWKKSETENLIELFNVLKT